MAVRKDAESGRSLGMKIKKGDPVVVIAGKDRGLEGKVIAAYPDRQKVLVQGVNRIKKHTKVNDQGSRGVQGRRHRAPRRPRCT